jgi:hypothetical protein
LVTSSTGTDFYNTLSKEYQKRLQDEEEDVRSYLEYKISEYETGSTRSHSGERALEEAMDLWQDNTT